MRNARLLDDINNKILNREYYKFKYLPFEGALPGLYFQQQTEDAINDIGNVAYATEQVADEALKIAQQAYNIALAALETANNALAVALSSNRNKLYRELIMSSVEIVNDVRQVCLSNNKMTEKQRLEIVFGIRPKLKLMNQKLKRLIRAVKYTRLSDVWAEIDYGARSEVDKPTIVQRCKERWRRNARP